MIGNEKNRQSTILLTEAEELVMTFKKIELTDTYFDFNVGK